MLVPARTRSLTLSGPVALGYRPNIDFAIKGIPDYLRSEIIILTEEEDSYAVYYQDMGRSREVARSSSFSVIRERFLEELADVERDAPAT